ncbi:unnamed protein product [Sphagnum jensenii]|uniref:TF-B3 domain-containing protein n=2 Tax=Sphagnum jensenii TaxID=128206 RepID=A0ABP0XK99_9BRYO
MFAMHGMKHQLKAAMNTSISNGAVFFVSRIGKCSVKPPFQHIFPPYFIETIDARKRKLKDEMVLEVEQSGVRWRTSILRSRSCTRIGKGWRQFVEGNGLEYGDRLLFTLVRVNRFVVQLFDASGRKKKIRQRKKRTLELFRDKKELSGDGKEEKKQQQQLDSLLNAAAATAAASGRKRKQLNELGGSRKKYLGSLRSRQHTEKRRKEEVEEQLGKKKTKTKVSRVHEVEYLSKRRTVTDEERGKVMIAARRCAGALCNPSFQIRMRDSAVYRRYLLEIPTAFLLDSKLLLQLPPSSSDSSSGRCTTKISWVALVDCDNNAWEVICRRGQKQHQNRLLLSPAGWARFARDHFLEEGDECIFELQQQQQEEHNKTDNSSSCSVVLATFRVHIFRVLEIQNLSSKAVTGSNPSSKD